MIISYKQFDNYAKKIERQTRKRTGRCWAWTSLQNAVDIHEVQTDKQQLIVDDDWKKKIESKANQTPKN